MAAPTVLLAPLVVLALAAGAVPAGPPAVAPVPPAARRVDRIVAVVDEDPILLSDVERLLALGLIEVPPTADEPARRRRALDALIAERLRFHEVDRFGFADISPALVDEQFARLRERLGSDEEFRATLQRVGMDETALRQLLARQLMVLTYVEERLGPRVFVSLEEIRRYYDETLVPEMAARGEAVPPIEEVREQIRAVLKERRLNDEVDRWTLELRRDADVLDFLAEPQPALPPRVIDVQGGAAPSP